MRATRAKEKTENQMLVNLHIITRSGQVNTKSWAELLHIPINNSKSAWQCLISTVSAP